MKRLYTVYKYTFYVHQYAEKYFEKIWHNFSSSTAAAAFDIFFDSWMILTPKCSHLRKRLRLNSNLSDWSRAKVMQHTETVATSPASLSALVASGATGMKRPGLPFPRQCSAVLKMLSCFIWFLNQHTTMVRHNHLTRQSELGSLASLTKPLTQLILLRPGGFALIPSSTQLS